MKVCHINNLYHPFSRGGAEQVVSSLVKEGRASGIESMVITARPYFSSPRYDRSFFVPSLFMFLDRIPTYLRLFWHIWDTLDFITAWRVKKLVQKNNPDIVILHNLKGISLLTPLFLSLLPVKLIMVCHDVQLLHPSGLVFYGRETLLGTIPARIYQFINRRILSVVDKFIFPSEWLEKLFRQHGLITGQKSRVMSLLPFKECAPVMDRARSRFVFGYLGQMNKAKSPETALKAFGILETEGYAFMIAGGGAELDRLKRTFSTDKRIEFMGVVHHDRVKSFFSAIDCLIVPSLCYENLPTVIMEAYASGKPVIASRIGGIPEIVPEDCLFEPGNISDLASLMEKTAKLSDTKKSVQQGRIMAGKRSAGLAGLLTVI